MYRKSTPFKPVRSKEELEGKYTFKRQVSSCTAKEKQRDETVRPKTAGHNCYRPLNQNGLQRPWSSSSLVDHKRMPNSRELPKFTSLRPLGFRPSYLTQNKTRQVKKLIDTIESNPKIEDEKPPFLVDSQVTLSDEGTEIERSEVSQQTQLEPNGEEPDLESTLIWEPKSPPRQTGLLELGQCNGNNKPMQASSESHSIGVHCTGCEQLKAVVARLQHNLDKYRYARAKLRDTINGLNEENQRLRSANKSIQNKYEDKLEQPDESIKKEGEDAITGRENLRNQKRARQRAIVVRRYEV